MKKYLRFVYGILSVLIFELVTCPAMGQGLIKKNIAPEDYKLWSKLYMDKISDYGGWISYYKKYESGFDTLFVKNVHSNKEFSFLKCTDAKFAGEKLFGCEDKNKNLKILNLTSGISFSISNVKTYAFSSNTLFIISAEFNTENISNLYVRKTNGELVKSVKNVTEYKMNNLGNELIYVSSENNISSIGRIYFSTKIVEMNILSNLPKKVQDLTWSKDQTTIAFYGTDVNCALYFYQFKNKKLSVLKNLPDSEFLHQEIAYDNALPLKISNVDNAVFFSYRNSEKPIMENALVEIWNAKDKYLYPKSMLINSYNQPFLGVWYPEKEHARSISNKQFQWAALTGNQNFAIVADPLQYEPQYELFGDVDFYLMDLKTGKKELLIEKMSSHPSHIGTSPCGRYINYYKNSSWWIYDITTKTHTNLTAGLNTEFDKSKQDPDFELYGFEGWTADGKSVLIYDQFDIWQISVDRTIRSRITQGKEQKICFRMVDENKINKHSFNYSGVQSGVYDGSKKNIIWAESKLNADSGYFILSQNKLDTLVFKKGKISKLLKAKKKGSYVFMEQNFNNSPRIILKASPKTKLKTVVKTNRQQQNFYWGFSEMIHYADSKNRPLNGALFYPANYKSTVKYPMVVYLYSTTSSLLHDYVNPTDHNNYGFNITTLTANGYFVLLADIAYEKGDPGISALDCVTNAVKCVSEKEIVDLKRIGLLAHSFGGYEVNFIITQSNLFAAAVSGSAVSDNIGAYFTFNAEHLNAEIWRYENQQYRMGKSFYEDKNSYYRNSPILNAEHINTPLLTWSGLNDQGVRPDQSLAFYIALRRLQKTHVMLRYPNEGHILKSFDAQEDLSKKTMEWFDFYLKNNSPASWINKYNH